MIYSIQALRAMASYMVAFGHIPLEAMPPGMAYLRGAIGVDLFFVISGFIMAFTCSGLAQGAAAGRLFFVRRMIRILPMYYVVTLAILIYLLATHSPRLPDFTHLWKSFLLWPEESGGEFLAPLIPAGWTLSFEFYFYLWYALLLWFRRATPTFLSLALLAPILVGRFVSLHSPAWSLITAPINLEFVFGLWIFHFWSDWSKVWLVRIGWIALLVSVPAVLYVKEGIAAAYVGSYGSSQITLPNAMVADRWLVWGVPSALLVLGFFNLEGFLRARARHLVQWLGDGSYSLYLMHQGIAAFLTGVLLELKPWHAFVYVAVMTAASLFAFRWIERPMNTFLRARWEAYRNT